MKFNFFLSLPVLVTLAACGGGSGPSNPNQFTVDIDDGKLTGKYNSAGFGTDEVKSLLVDSCKDRKLASYGEQADASGMVAFTATCAGGLTAVGGNIEIERAASGEVVSESLTYDENGNLSI